MECQEKHTNRQYEALADYLDSLWNKPSLTDHYLMQVAAEVHGVLRKKIPSLNDMVITFKKKEVAPEGVQVMSQEEFDLICQQARMVWEGRIALGRMAEERRNQP